MEKRSGLLYVILAIALIALAVSIVSYMRIPEKTGIEVAEEPAIHKHTHTSEEIQLDIPAYTGTSNGFVIKFENGKVLYLSGDTALFSDMKWVIHDYYRPDIAIIPIGNVFTMDPKDAAFATTWIDPEYVIPYHYKIFPFLEQTPDEFVRLVNEYKTNNKTRAEPIALEPGVEREIEGVKITWLGHGGFFVVSPTGTRIMIDPWLTPNPDTPAGFKDMSKFERVDLLLITHGHLDHFDADDMKKVIELYNPPIVCQWEVMGYLQPRIPGQYLMMNKGGRITKEVISKQGITANMPDDLEITMVHADHSSSAP
ncbi:MAG: MBL fold metallo-hydrolase [Nanoarchaeota archaeon]|nr:MBL fold metallo-hydrolase [Nanoarchaeota archaeon]